MDTSQLPLIFTPLKSWATILPQLALTEIPHPVDCIEINTMHESVLVEHIRQIPEHLATRPLYGVKKWIVLYGLDTASETVQNSLLKTLEEYPPYISLVLSCSQITQLLPTILSRCEVRQLSDELVRTTTFPDLASILQQTYTKKIATAAEFNEVGKTVSFLSQLVWEQVSQLEAAPTLEKINHLHQLIEGLDMAQVNTSPKLVVEKTLFALTPYLQGT